MPLEHLLPPTVGVVPREVTYAEKVPPPRFQADAKRWAAPSTRTLYLQPVNRLVGVPTVGAVWPPNFIPENGWVV